MQTPHWMRPREKSHAQTTPRHNATAPSNSRLTLTQSHTSPSADGRSQPWPWTCLQRAKCRAE
eukprot:3869326-Rhodomonas_salina.1